MNKKDWNEGLNNIDPALVEEHIEEMEKIAAKSCKKPIMWTKYISVAAAVCLVFGTVVVSLILNTTDDNTTDDNTTVVIPDVPVFETPQYSAADIAKIVNYNKYDDAVATNAYTKVYAPNERYLYIDPLPSDKYIEIYKCSTQDYELNSTEFENFLNPIFSKAEQYLGETIPEYVIKRDNYYVNSGIKWCLETTGIRLNNGYIEAEQRGSYHLLSLSGSSKRILLDGENIQIDLHHSDDEIIASLEWAKDKLFDMFGVEFTDVEVERSYSQDNQIPRISVLYYNKKPNALGKMKDYIKISFNRSGNGYYVRFCKSRGEDNNKCELESKMRMLNLDEAEKLLYKGYVFGNHVCELCMRMQDKVSFEGYDCVDIEYIYDDDESPTIAIPFYAFYKNIGTAKSGNIIYAKTLVCAIELLGYDEYFETQIKNHSSGVEFGTIKDTETVTEETVIDEPTTEEGSINETETLSEIFVTEEIVTEEIITE